VQIPAYKTES